MVTFCEFMAPHYFVYKLLHLAALQENGVSLKSKLKYSFENETL